MPLLSDKDTTPKDFGTGSGNMSLLTYSEVLLKFPIADDSGEDTDLEGDPDPNPSKGDDHEIEKIMEHVKVDEDDYDYCVRWKGWGPKWDTWHSQEDLMGCQQLIEDYWRQRGDVVRPEVQSIDAIPARSNVQPK